MFHCLPDGNLAEAAGQLGKRVEHRNQSQPNPGLSSLGTPCILIPSIHCTFQLDELYVEIMYCILHMIGSDAEREEQSALVAHLREAFHMCDDKHAQLHDIASMREEPYLKASHKWALFITPQFFYCN